MTIYRKKKGISLLIAVILVGIITLFGLIVRNVVITSIRQSANVNRSNKAYFGTEGALEQGLLENANEGIGYSGDPQNPSYAGCQGADCPQLEFQVKGQVPVLSSYEAAPYDDMFGVPQPGGGNLIEGCDPLKAFKDKNFNYTQSSGYVEQPSGPYNATEHPCNWNKIKVGESVTVPLFKQGSSGPENLITSGSDEFILRVRTPCENSEEFCAKIDRYDLSILNEVDDYGNNEPIVTWQIDGEDQNGESLVLNPYINTLSDTLQFQSSIISEQRINVAKNTPFDGIFTVLRFSNNMTDSLYWGVDLNDCIGPITTYLISDSNDCIDYDWNERNISNPAFKLSVINSTKADDATIPYLEYQILTNFITGLPPTSSDQTIRAEGLSGEFKQVLEVKQPQESGLLEYVIQQ